MDWTFVLYLFIMMLIFPLLFILSFRQYRGMKRLMQDQAVKRNGTVTGSFFLPQLKCQYKNLPVLVISIPGSKHRSPKTHIGVTLSTPVPASVKIHKESIATRVGKKLGVTDLEVGNEEFDREFLIRTQDEAFAKNIMNFTIQNKLLELKQQRPCISIEGTLLAVEVPQVVRTEEGYDQLFSLTFALVDRIKEL